MSSIHLPYAYKIPCHMSLFNGIKGIKRKYQTNLLYNFKNRYQIPILRAVPEFAYAMAVVSLFEIKRGMRNDNEPIGAESACRAQCH